MSIKVGTVLLDNDPRNGGRTITVLKVDKKYAYYYTGKRTCRIRLNRIFLDQQKRARGYNLERGYSVA